MDLSDAAAEASTPLVVAAGAAGRAGMLGDAVDAEMDTISASNPDAGLAAVALIDPPLEGGVAVDGPLDAAASAWDVAAGAVPLAAFTISRTVLSRASGCTDA